MPVTSCWGAGPGTLINCSLGLKADSMAVDVMHHVSPTQSYAKMAFDKKTKSTEELNFETAYPREPGNVASSNLRPNSTSTSGSDKSSSCSLLEFSLIERSEQAVDQLVTSRKQLEDEIEVLIRLHCNKCGVDLLESAVLSWRAEKIWGTNEL